MLKGNQGTLDELPWAPRAAYIAVVTHDIAWLNAVHDWPGLQAIGHITTATVSRTGKDTQDLRYVYLPP